eukprot:CAMPEP_0114150254 /NCGR_PEP_ID=MMETSP0043_2-20121206/22606_1 /TAXON_ID=464988 /ORGANISM="Hemiselmis andersenii, Strain CCMP644" /LENGTH=176 /DNA_ID=CAMNT_0001244975 /DNA_START=128 /DNA_END=655 /DNA_ORIENTATION=+
MAVVSRHQSSSGSSMVALPESDLAAWEREMRASSSQWRDNAERRAKRGFNKVWARVVRSLPFDQSIDLGDDGKRLFDYARVCGGVLVGRVPRGPADLRRLRDEEGVNAVLSLNESWELREQGWGDGMIVDAGMSWEHLPTPDFSAPRMEDIVKAVVFIMRHAGVPAPEGSPAAAQR